MSVLLQSCCGARRPTGDLSAVHSSLLSLGLLSFRIHPKRLKFRRVLLMLGGIRQQIADLHCVRWLYVGEALHDCKTMLVVHFGVVDTVHHVMRFWIEFDFAFG